MTIITDSNGEYVVDFDKGPTKLYGAICAGDWDEAIVAASENPIESKTWVVRYHTDEDDDTQVLWRFLPLHSACARQPPDDVVEALLQANSNAPLAKDDQGMLPLHYACGNRASDSVVNMLLISYPEGASEKDPRTGKLPIHHLCQWGASSQGVVNMLLTVNPGSIHEEDSNGYTPIDLASAADYPEKNEVVMALKRASVASRGKESKLGGLKKKAETDKIVKEQEEKIAKMKEELKSMKKENFSMAEKERELALSKKKSERQINSLKKELDMKESRAILSDKSTDRENTFTLKKYEKQISVLKKGLNQTESREAALLKENEAMKKICDKKIASLKKELSQREAKDETCRKSEDVMQSQGEEITNMREEMENLKEQVMKQQKTVVLLEDELDDHKSNAETSKEIVTLEENKVIALTEELTILHMDYNSVKKDKKRLEAELSDAVGNSYEMEAREVSILQEIEGQEDEVERLNKELEEREEQMNSLEATMAADKVESGLDKDTIAKYLSEQDISEKTILDLQSELHTLKEKSDEDSEVNSATVYELEKELSEATLELALKNTKYETVECQVEDMSGEVATLKTANVSLESEVEDLMKFKETCDHMKIQRDEHMEAIRLLLGRHLSLKELVSKQESNMRSAASEREHKILELALIEEKLRGVSVEDQEMVTDGMEEMDADLCALKALVAEQF